MQLDYDSENPNAQTKFKDELNKLVAIKKFQDVENKNVNFKFDFIGTGGTKGIPDVYRSFIVKRLKKNTKRIFIGSAGIESTYLVNNKVNFVILPMGLRSFLTSAD